MQKLSNPFRDLPGYRCFGCSPDNENGLRMTFYDEGEYIISNWDPRECFSGYLGMLHGGIQSTLLDEIASWVVMTRIKTSGVTSRMNIRYLKPVIIEEGTLHIRGRLQQYSHRIAVIKAELFNAKNELAAEAEIRYYIFTEEEAREKYSYPGVDKFYNP